MILYHLTAKVDFRLDPKKRPQNNTTMGGTLEPGIFLCRDVETWANGYGYWQPWVVEFEVPDAVLSGSISRGYGGEVYVPAEFYPQLRILRVLPIDAYCREKFQDWGWTEDATGLTFDTEEPLPPKEKGSWSDHGRFPYPGYRYHGDARHTDAAWQARYKARITKFRRGRTNAYTSSLTAMMDHRPSDDGPMAHDLLAEGDSEWSAPPDIYDRPDLYTGYREYIAGLMPVLRAVRGKPSATVTLYRAQPDDAGLRTGDWVTLTRAYAERDLASDPEGRVVETYHVPASTVRWAGDDLMEWGYFGPPLPAAHTASAKVLRLYHGTTARAAEIIRREGLTQQAGLYVPGWPMLTTSREQATRYATGPDPVVLEFAVPEAKVYAHGRQDAVLWAGDAHTAYDYPDAVGYALKAPLGPEYLVDTHTALRVTADEDHSDHVMVCLQPSEGLRKVWADLDETTHDVDDLHVTLFYLGTTEEAGGEPGRERLFRALYDMAIHSGYRGLTGKINGLGTFSNPDSNVLIALFDIPGIAEFRTALGGYMRDHGVPLGEEKHGFTPHMTLATVDGPVRRLPAIPGSNPDKEHFTSLVLSWGEEWQEIPLA